MCFAASTDDSFDDQDDGEEEEDPGNDDDPNGSVAARPPRCTCVICRKDADVDDGPRQGELRAEADLQSNNPRMVRIPSTTRTIESRKSELGPILPRQIVSKTANTSLAYHLGP